MDLHDIREDYCKQALSQHDCDPNPIKQFEKWLNEAITAKVNEPTGVNVRQSMKTAAQQVEWCC